MVAKHKIIKTTAYYLSYIALGFATGIIGPTLPGLSNHTGVNLGGISFLFPALSIGYLFGSFAGGRMFDKASGHFVTVAALILLLIVMTVIPLSPFLWMLLVLFFLSGIASGTIDVGGNTLLIWTHGEGVGPYMIGLHFFFGLGAFIAPMIVGQTIKLTSDITWAYWILAIICIPIAVYLISIRSAEHPDKTKDDNSNLKHRFLIVLIAAFMFLHVGAELSFGGWVYTYALKLQITDEAGASFLTSAYWGSLTIGRLIAVAIAVKMKPLPMLITSLFGCLLAAAVLLAFNSSISATWIGTILLGLSIAPLVPVTFTFAGEHMDITGRVAGWFVIGIGTGNMFFPWMVGQFFENIGPIVLPLINLITFALALGLIIKIIVVINKEKDGKIKMTS